MMQPAIDAETAARVRACLDRCSKRGADPVRELDKLGLLFHPALERQLLQGQVEKLAALLEETTVAQLSAPAQVPNNVLEMKRVTVAWLRNRRSGS